MDEAEPTPNTDDAPAEPVPMSCGERLKSARTQRGLTLKDVAASTHQSLDTLAALEAMETAHIAPTILRMQASMYADFLGLPAQEIAVGFSARRSAPDSANMPGEKMRTSQLVNRRRLWPIGLAAAALVTVGIVFWSLQSGPDKPTDTPVSSKIVFPRATSPSAVQLPRANIGPELSIRATRSAWIEVRGSDGTIFRNRTMSSGERYYPRMDAAWTVTVRDAGAFEWWLGGHRVGALGEADLPVYSVSIDAATARGLEQLSTALANAESASQGPR